MERGGSKPSAKIRWSWGESNPMRSVSTSPGRYASVQVTMPFRDRAAGTMFIVPGACQGFRDRRVTIRVVRMGAHRPRKCSPHPSRLRVEGRRYARDFPRRGLM